MSLQLLHSFHTAQSRYPNMADVLPAPGEPGVLSRFGSSSPLKRSSTSYTSLYSNPNIYTNPNCTTSSTPTVLSPPLQVNSRPDPPTNSPELRARPSIAARRSVQDLSDSPSLSLNSSQRSSSLESSSTTSFDDELSFPSYDGGMQFLQSDEPLDLLSPDLEAEYPPPSLKSETSGFRIDDTPPSATTGSSVSESPLWTPSVVDDTAVRPHPSRHVDYLSHDWCEEDIWSSWRHIVSRRNVYGQRSRLENASWRTWGKSKYNLPTISPETLNW